MINNQKDLGDLINKLSTPIGRAKAVVDLCKQYQVPEENVREAIVTFEEIYDTDNSHPAQKSKEARKALETAANLARKITWIEKTIDLTAKISPERAAEIAEEFSFNTRALELYNEANDPRAIHIAEKLGLNNKYVGLCVQHSRFKDAIKKCLELNQEERAKEVFKSRFQDVVTKYRNLSSREKELVKLAKETGLHEYAIVLCEEKNRFELLAEIAAETEQHELALKNFEKARKFQEAAGQALLMTEISVGYFGIAKVLYFREVEQLEGREDHASALEILKHIDLRISSSNVLDRIFEKYIKLEFFKEGSEFFDKKGDTNRALELLEKGNMLPNARKLAIRDGLTEKVREYNEKLGWHERSAEIEMEEGNVEEAIQAYRAQIEEYVSGENYDFAAGIALKAAEACGAENAWDISEEFSKMSVDLFLKEREKDEKKGQWESAAKMAEKAGNKEKAAVYRQLDNIARAYHKP